jgi:hypothetical protein
MGEPFLVAMARDIGAMTFCCNLMCIRLNYSNIQATCVEEFFFVTFYSKLSVLNLKCRTLQKCRGRVKLPACGLGKNGFREQGKNLSLGQASELVTRRECDDVPGVTPGSMPFIGTNWR